MKSLVLRPEQYPEYDVLDSSVNTLDGLSPLTVLIGVNNSGKSRLLRQMFLDRKDCFTPGHKAFADVSARLGALSETVADIMAEAHLESYGCIKALALPVDLRNVVTGEQYWAEVEVLLAELQQANRKLRFKPVVRRKIANYDIERAMRKAGSLCQDSVQVAKAALPETYRFKKVYTPALRGLRSVGTTPNIYRKRTIDDYDFATIVTDREDTAFVQAQRHDVFSGLEMYAIVRSFLLGDLEQREKIAAFELFLSTNFFDGVPVAIIPRESPEVLHVKIGAQREEAIHNLGDGIQQIIILTFPMFLFRDQSLLLYIEEPENYLHPGLLRKLIDALINTEGERQTFVATHSNHFLDLTLDNDKISVYKLSRELPDGEEREKVPRFRISPSTTADFRLLEELGVRNSSVLLANCTIWVEGITDRWYIRKFLELHDNKFKDRYLEDVHYAFVEYGGSNITHWSFLDREEEPIKVEPLCGRLFLVCDRDKKKEDRHEELREYLDERLHVLPCLEIENLLTPAVIKSVVEGYEDEGVELNDFNQADYKLVRLAKFIEASVLIDKTKSKRVRGKFKSSGGKAADVHPYAGKYGQLKDKTGFAKRALAAMEPGKDLSPGAIELAKRIAAFVAGCNP